MCAALGRRRWLKFTNPRNSRSLHVVVGWGNSLTACTLSSNGRIPWLLNWCLRNYICGMPNTHFDRLMRIPWSRSLNTIWRLILSRDYMYQHYHVVPIVLSRARVQNTGAQHVTKRFNVIKQKQVKCNISDIVHLSRTHLGLCSLIPR